MKNINIFLKMISSIFKLFETKSRVKDQEYQENDVPRVEVTGGSSNNMKLSEVDKDAWEAWPEEESRRLSIRLLISYIDRNNNKTEREIRTTSFDDCHVGAYCEMRGANRSFKYKNIANCIDINTGEDISDVFSHLDKIYNQSPQKTVDDLFDKIPNTLKVLTYVARADGQFRKNEKLVICNYLIKMSNDKRLTPELIGKALNDQENQSLSAFKVSAGRSFRNEGINIAGCISCCQIIVNTQKTVSAGEKEALEYLEKLSIKVKKALNK
jgi:hypothetical protein